MSQNNAASYARDPSDDQDSIRAQLESHRTTADEPGFSMPHRD